MSRLLSLFLPFTAGALLHALKGLCRQPHLPALAPVGFALLQPQQQAVVGISMLTCLVMLLTCQQVSLLLWQLHKHIHFFPDIVNMLNMAVTRNVARLRGKQND